MPVNYGQTQQESSEVMNDVTQFAKWFDLNDMDFVVQNISGRWQCIAWKREYTETQECGVIPMNVQPVSGAISDSLSIALLRCYEEARNIQRRLSLIY